MMDAVDPFGPITGDPTPPADRLLQLARESQATAMRNRQASEVVAAHLDCDAKRCGIVLNAARREIARLRRGLLSAAEKALVAGRVPARRPDVVELGPSALSSPPAERPAHAPDPVGAPSPPARPAPPAPEPPREISYAYITNQGTLLDVLA